MFLIVILTNEIMCAHPWWLARELVFFVTTASGITVSYEQKQLRFETSLQELKKEVNVLQVNLPASCIQSKSGFTTSL